ncbi:MAG: hypothetical protein ACRDDW_02875 [Candidatus Rhabdochlamydia sp.]
MTYSLSNSLSSISSSMQTIGNHISDRLKPKNLLKVGCVVAPIFAALQMASSVPGADAGLICFHICLGTCLTATGGAFPPACYVACAATCSTNPV